MGRSLPHLARGRRGGPVASTSPSEAHGDFDVEALLPLVRDIWVRVPCAGCGGAHEMTCAELLARQLIRGAGWASEECDDGAAFGAILSPGEVAACAGDPDAIRTTLERRGVLCAPGVAGGPANPGHEPNHILLAH